jgi:amino-acid racemase
VKTIGLLGGMSWESSIEYERLINTEVRRRLGGVASADLIIRSYDFAEIEALQEAGDWDGAGRRLAGDAVRLEDAGAELVVLCTNTMHVVAPAIEQAISVPFLHIADATADAIVAEGIDRVGLLGTRYTMERDFYRERVASHGISVTIPGEPDRTRIHRIIFEELVRGRVVASSRSAVIEMIDRLVAAGADGIISGCTEIELLVGPDDIGVPLFASARLHAMAAVDLAMG